jgi:hypothetical protein
VDLKATSTPSLERLAAAYCYLCYSDRIDGWMYQTTGLAMMELLWLQESAGLLGNIAEIGVHHGLSALALIAASRESETMFAIDLFDQQDLNIDNSGEGNLAIFQQHIRHLFPRANISIIAKSSLEVRGAELENGLSNIRFLSIDGGHTKELTLNDLAIANTCLASHGIACLDDIFNVQWTGVVSGLFEFLNKTPDLVPFALFPNKIFLCRKTFKNFYLNGCRSIFEYALDKRNLEFHEHLVDLYGERWPILTKRLAVPKVAASAAPCIRQLEQSSFPVRRPWVEKPSDEESADSVLDVRNRLVLIEQRYERERRRCEHAEQRAAAAQAQLQAVWSSTSWHITAPLRWIKRRVKVG